MLIFSKNPPIEKYTGSGKTKVTKNRLATLMLIFILFKKFDGLKNFKLKLESRYLTSQIVLHCTQGKDYFAVRFC
jgi:hypothetical protein